MTEIGIVAPESDQLSESWISAPVRDPDFLSLLFRLRSLWMWSGFRPSDVGSCTSLKIVLLFAVTVLLLLLLLCVGLLLEVSSWPLIGWWFGMSLLLSSSSCLLLSGFWILFVISNHGTFLGKKASRTLVFL